MARAILIDTTGNEMLAERLCRPFTWEVVSKLPADEFRVTRADVLAWVESKGLLQRKGLNPLQRSQHASTAEPKPRKAIAS